MPQRITVVDAFTDRPFAGNPAAVCLLAKPADDAWMKDVAREMNLSETAFLHPLDEPGTFSLRWLTPAVEVDLCGHATLASAHVLWEQGVLETGHAARFSTRSGILVAEQKADEIEMDFPALFTEPVEPPIGLDEALGAEAVFYGSTKMDLLVELRDEQTVIELTPDFSSLAKVPVRGIIVTSRSSRPGIDFVSRFFAPQCGVNEDPVTGSAHCALATFWGDRLQRTEMVGFQASPRGGTVRVRLDGNRVKLRGKAVTTLSCELLFEPY